MKFETFIAKRYLKSKHKINFISIISIISIVGITLGVASLVVVLSVFNGFSGLVKEFLISMDPHIRVENTDFKAGYNQDSLLSIIKSVPEVKAVSPFVTGKVLALNGGNSDVVVLKGIDPVNGVPIYNLEENIFAGDYKLKDNENDYPPIIIGIRMADKFELIVGDTLTLISADNIESVIASLAPPKTITFRITGIFRSNNNEYDLTYSFTSIDNAAFLLGYENDYQGFEIKLNDIKISDKVKEQLISAIPYKNFTVNNWYDFHKDLYSVMQIERWTAYIILSLIIAVASFNILGSLTMSVIEKKRDIGILKTMGADSKSVMRIFMFEGILIGAIGTLLGLLLGLAVCLVQIKFNIYPLDPAQYKISYLPLELRLTDFIYISLSSMALAILASWYPAKRAVKVNIIEAIKWE